MKGHRSRRADWPSGGCQAGEGLPGGENLASRSLALRGRGHLGSLWLGLDFDRAHAAFADLLVDDLFFLHGPPRRRTVFASTLLCEKNPVQHQDFRGRDGGRSSVRLDTARPTCGALTVPRVIARRAGPPPRPCLSGRSVVGIKNQRIGIRSVGRSRVARRSAHRRSRPDPAGADPWSRWPRRRPARTPRPRPAAPRHCRGPAPGRRRAPRGCAGLAPGGRSLLRS